jgi:predicted Zn-dependent protease
MGRPDEAVPVLRSLAEQKDPAPLLAVLVMLGDCYGQLGDLEEAGRWLRLACQREDVTAEARLQLAKVLLKMDEPDLAMGALTETLRAEPANTDALAMRATLLLEAGQTEKAVAFLGDAVRRQPKDTLLRVLLGRALVIAGRTEAAVVEFKQVLAEDPSDALARAMLEEIAPPPNPFQDAVGGSGLLEPEAAEPAGEGGIEAVAGCLDEGDGCGEALSPEPWWEEEPDLDVPGLDH